MLIVYEVRTKIFRKLDFIPEDFSPGQVVWHPNGKTLVGTVWENNPYPWQFPDSVNKVNICTTVYY
jgi:hypothetical protein